MQAVEALTRIHNVIATLPNLNIDDQKVAAEIANDSGLIAKVQIVGSERTVKAVITIMASIGTAILELTLERGVLVARKNTIELLGGFRSKAQNEIERYISIMKNLNLEGNQDNRLWDTIEKQLKFETQERDRYGKEVADLWNVQNREHLQFTKNCMRRFFEISALLPDAVLAVREELNLTISGEAYLDICNKSIEQGEKVFGDFLRKLSGEIT